ncbi:MAG: transcription termination factor Rho [Puniceicoccaceae bacterium]|nr:MAG: transcription termination factor Rho [Puniceicoccaceae bacterium]
MSSEEENKNAPQENATAEPEAAPKKRAAKKAAKKSAKKAVKKRAAKKRSAPKEADATQADMFTPGEIAPAQPARATPAEGAERSERSERSSRTERADSDSDGDEVTFSADIAVDGIDDGGAAGEARSKGPSKHQPKHGKPGSHSQHPQQNPQKQQNPQNPQPGGDRFKGNHKFNKNNKNNPNNPNNPNHPKRKRGKNRWQNKGKRDREEETPIEFGELLDWVVLERREELDALAEALKSGGGEPLDYVRIYNLPLPELREEVAGLGLQFSNAPNRDQLIDAVAKRAGEQKTAIRTTGILELLEDDDGGLLVYERDNYRVKALSAYVPRAFIKHYGLQRGHIVQAQLHPHREGESCPFVVKIESVMGQDPETLSEIVPFTERVPYYPTSRILMEAHSEAKWDNLSMRVVDCLTPVGFGQRGLIVAPPRTGKTILMQGMANSIQKNYPDAHLIILLIDERPEEVTDFRRQVKGEVISSTFDESAESHVHAAEMVIEKARRMVETGRDVVILLDSITRLARAYNTTMPSSGKILSGGVEANALQKPKRFFGSARNIEDGGSLTIIATALVETGSKMDEVIFEEFKGTGNMELHLDRGLSDKRIFPALSMDKSGTRKEELLYHPDEMLKIYSLRRAMKGLPSTDAMEMLIQRIKKTNTNAEFLMSVAR